MLEGTVPVVQTFRQYCKSALTVREFNNLHKAFEVSKYRCTWLLNNPSRLPSKLLVILAYRLDKSPLWLMEEYECGIDELTVREHKQLLEDFKFD